MANYAALTATEVTGATVEDCGVTHRDGDYTERTVIVRGTISRTGQPIAAAVLLDADGRSMDSPDSFEVQGVANYEMAASVAAADESDSFRALIECDLRALAEQLI